MTTFAIFVKISVIAFAFVDSLNAQGCICESSEDNNQPINESGCYFGNSSQPCSGRGVCCCGICDCDSRMNPAERITGQFCECDNFSCDRSNGQICGGEERGTCDCGQCICIYGWTGETCDCQESDVTCYAPNGRICSGHGSCECGRCKCDDSEEGLYSGQYCEDCPTCPSKCDQYKECVQCQVFQTGPLTKEQCDNCPFIPVLVEKLELKVDENICIILDESDDCKFTFKYKITDDNEQLVYVQSAKDCPEPANLFSKILRFIGK